MCVCEGGGEKGGGGVLGSANLCGVEIKRKIPGRLRYLRILWKTNNRNGRISRLEQRNLSSRRLEREGGRRFGVGWGGEGAFWRKKILLDGGERGGDEEI